MKKSLLGFFTLVCIGLLPAATFAQDAPGTSGGDAGTGIDGGTTVIDGGLTSFTPTPPPSVKSLKRNNGNATAFEGTAEARLQVSGGTSADIQLLAVTSLDGSVQYDVVKFAGNGIFEKNYISYSLSKNINPAKKLMFYFRTSEGTLFKIPETN
jgi:hypothetical protein